MLYMNIVMTLQISSTNTAKTESVAEKIGRRLKGGECIELVSDVGGGKTAFTRGLARGAGSKDHVSSPTFTICNIYKAKDKTIHHMDFYRLSEPGLIEHELSEAFTDKLAVVVVEWSDIVKHVLPEDRLTISFKTTGDDARELTLTFPKSLAYLVEEL